MYNICYKAALELLLQQSNCRCYVKKSMKCKELQKKMYIRIICVEEMSLPNLDRKA